MFNGKNESGKEFEVINEDGEFIDAFDDHQHAVLCAKSQPWYQGNCDIRREPRKFVKDTTPEWWMYQAVE